MRVELARSYSSVPVARHLVQDALKEMGVASEDTADIAVAVSEACTNAVDHAGGGEAYEVDLALDGDECRLSIADEGAGFDLPSARDRYGDARSSSGRGLVIIQALMDCVDVTSVPGTGTTLTMTKRVHLGPRCQRRPGVR